MRRTSFNDGWTVGTKSELLRGVDRRTGHVASAGDAAPRRHHRHRAIARRECRDSVLPRWELGVQEVVRACSRGRGERRHSRIRRRLSRRTGARERHLGRPPTRRLLGLHRPGRPSAPRRQPNEVKVEARSHDDSRWYSGGGIYRSVWLLQGGRVHLVPGGLQVVTPEIDDDLAVVAVSAEVREPVHRAVECRCCGSRSSTRTATGWPKPRRRSPPFQVTSSRRGNGSASGAHALGSRTIPPSTSVGPVCWTARRSSTRNATTFGIRSLTVDPMRGLRINGETVLLRGACVHHDNGPLGAATVGRVQRSAGSSSLEASRIQRHPERPQPLEQTHARVPATVSACSSWTRPSTCGRNQRASTTTRCDFPTGGRRTWRPWSARTSTIRVSSSTASATRSQRRGRRWVPVSDVRWPRRSGRSTPRASSPRPSAGCWSAVPSSSPNWPRDAARTPRNRTARRA